MSVPKTKKCTKGTACKGTCINANKACRDKQSAEGKAKTKAIKEKLALIRIPVASQVSAPQTPQEIEKQLKKQRIKALAELHPEFTKGIEAFEIIKPRAFDTLLERYQEKKKLDSVTKREQKKLSAYRDKQIAQSQHSFDNSPEVIRGAVAKYGYPEMQFPEADKSAYYRPTEKVLHMDSIDSTDPSFDALYRHEHGHYLDHQLRDQGSEERFISSSPKGKEALSLDSKAINAKKFNAAVKPLKVDADYSLMEDIAGALTKNRLGSGHSKEYWNIEGHRETEVFANIVSLIGKNNSKYDEAVKAVAPNSYNFVMEQLKNADSRDNT